MTHASPLAFGLPLFAGWFVLVAALPACQSKDEKKSGKIKVTVVVVLAAEDGSEIDPRLKQIADEVRKQSPQLKSFKLKSMTNRSLAEAEKSSFACPDGQKIDITVTHGADMDNRVGLAVVAPCAGRDRLSHGLWKVLAHRYALPDERSGAIDPSDSRAALSGRLERIRLANAGLAAMHIRSEWT